MIYLMDPETSLKEKAATKLIIETGLAPALGGRNAISVNDKKTESLIWNLNYKFKNELDLDLTDAECNKLLNNKFSDLKSTDPALHQKVVLQIAKKLPKFEYMKNEAAEYKKAAEAENSRKAEEERCLETRELLNSLDDALGQEKVKYETKPLTINEYLEEKKRQAQHEAEAKTPYGRWKHKWQEGKAFSEAEVQKIEDVIEKVKKAKENSLGDHPFIYNDVEYAFDNFSMDYSNEAMSEKMWERSVDCLKFTLQRFNTAEFAKDFIAAASKNDPPLFGKDGEEFFDTIDLIANKAGIGGLSTEEAREKYKQAAVQLKEEAEKKKQEEALQKRWDALKKQEEEQKLTDPQAEDSRSKSEGQ
jgi:hypothetical protein